MAVNMGSMKTDIESSGYRPIDSIENLAHDEPQESGADKAINDGLECDEARKGPACR